MRNFGNFSPTLTLVTAPSRLGRCRPTNPPRRTSVCQRRRESAPSRAKTLPKSWHHELMSFGPHGQHGTRSGSHYNLGNAAHDYVGQTSSTVCGEYN